MIGMTTSNAPFNPTGDASARCNRKYREKSSNELVAHDASIVDDDSFDASIVDVDVVDDSIVDVVADIDMCRKLSMATLGIPVNPINKAFSGCLAKLANNPKAHRKSDVPRSTFTTKSWSILNNELGFSSGVNFRFCRLFCRLSLLSGFTLVTARLRIVTALFAFVGEVVEDEAELSSDVVDDDDGTTELPCDDSSGSRGATYT